MWITRENNGMKRSKLFELEVATGLREISCACCETARPGTIPCNIVEPCTERVLDFKRLVNKLRGPIFLQPTT
jgi:hypothetical protein